MRISILSQADFDLIRRCLPAHDCQRLAAADSWQRSHESTPHLLIIDASEAGVQLHPLLQQAGMAPAIPVLLLASDDASTLTTLTTLPAAHAEIEFKPLRRHAVAARVRLLLQRAYPEHAQQQWQEFEGVRFESPAALVHMDGQCIALTQKEFALAVLLFSHLNRPLSRAYLQEAVWGQEDDNAVPTRTIDTHISRVRNKLNLKPEHGFRLSTVYGYGYQLERLQDEAAAAT